MLFMLLRGEKKSVQIGPISPICVLLYSVVQTFTQKPWCFSVISVRGNFFSPSHDAFSPLPAEPIDPKMHSADRRDRPKTSRYTSSNPLCASAENSRQLMKDTTVLQHCSAVAL